MDEGTTNADPARGRIDREEPHLHLIPGRILRQRVSCNEHSRRTNQPALLNRDKQVLGSMRGGKKASRSLRRGVSLAYEDPLQKGGGGGTVA
jgi:hypothetical protein